MRNKSTVGIVLKKRNIGENDKIITIYSPKFGKIEASAKGARKITSKFNGHLEILNICKLNIYSKNNRHTITQCQCIESFKHLKDNLNLSILSFQISEIFYKLTPLEKREEDFYKIITETINSLKNENNELIINSFKIKLLNASGTLPEISECGECRHKWSKDDSIYMGSDGHLTCNKCSYNKMNEEKISFNIVKLIKFITIAPYKQIQKIKLTTNEINKFQKISNKLLQYYINIDLKSEKVAQEILI